MGRSDSGSGVGRQIDASGPQNTDLRRALGLVRDERKLAVALRQRERHRFDVETALQLRDRVADLRETMTALLHDDGFWETLERGAREYSPEQEQRLRDIDASALASLLEMAGYHVPPRPPANELVDQTMAAIGTALLLGPDRENRHEAVANARAHLASLLYRVRRQLGAIEPLPEFADSALRDAARTLGAGARWLIPKVVGVAAGLIVEAHAPGTGTGVFVGKGLAKLAESGLEAIVHAVIGERHTPDHEALHAETDQPPVENPAALHLAALTDQLLVLNASEHKFGEHANQDRRPLVRAARRHLDRLRELIADHDLGSAMDPGVLDQLEAAVETWERSVAGRGPGVPIRVDSDQLEELKWHSRELSGVRPFSGARAF